jgi:hypothetical protein
MYVCMYVCVYVCVCVCVCVCHACTFQTLRKLYYREFSQLLVRTDPNADNYEHLISAWLCCSLQIALLLILLFIYKT